MDYGDSNMGVCRNISVLGMMVTVWSFEFQSCAGLQTRFRTFDTGFIYDFTT
jgi:hypothetical protein